MKVPSVFGLGDDPIQDPINNEYVENVLNITMAPNYASYTNDKKYYAIRTCNSYWLPQEYISETNVDAFYLGMASQATEREDFIITPDLRGKVMCSLCVMLWLACLLSCFLCVFHRCMCLSLSPGVWASGLHPS